MVSEQVVVLPPSSVAVNVITLVPTGKLADTAKAELESGTFVAGSLTAPWVSVRLMSQLSVQVGFATERKATQVLGSASIFRLVTLQV
ncbi:MAG: hypothetical protein EPGJADBJ_02700 [Saprospiraceae bacterium]|nr:hypothetical protein [Saprospiraceae bacterium]